MLQTDNRIDFCRMNGGVDAEEHPNRRADEQRRNDSLEYQHNTVVIPLKPVIQDFNARTMAPPR